MMSEPCAIWQGSFNSYGYGVLRFNGRRWMAHRFVVWTQGADILGTPWSGDLIVMHTCDNPACVRYSHLRVGTHADNSADRDAKDRGRFYGNPKMGGELNPRARLTADDVAVIRRLLADEAGPSQAEIARRFNVAPATINHIKHGRSWPEQKETDDAP